MNADRLTACCHQSERVFIIEHNFRGLDSTGCQLLVFWLYSYKPGRLVGISQILKITVISY